MDIFKDCIEFFGGLGVGLGIIYLIGLLLFKLTIKMFPGVLRD